MKQEIRARIDQIRQGIVPDGYTKTRSEITPTTWTPACLGDIYTERKEPGNESLPLLTVSIHSGVSDGELDEDELPKKVKRIEDKSQYKRAATGDLVFNMMRAWQGAIGTVRTEGMVSPAYIVAKPNGKVHPPFMDYYMKAPRMVGMINRQSYGVTDFRKRLYWDSFAPIPCVLPPVREQRKIAEILSTQDKAIELQERKIDELKRFKKGCLEKMFPRKGQKVPEKRFPGFTDDWEQRKLGELGSLKNGMNFSKEAMGIGFPFVNLQNIFGNNVIDVTNLGKAMASDSQLKDYNLLNGDVLFVRSSVKLQGVGEAALVPQNLENTTYSGFIIRFRDEYGLDNNFKRFLFGIESVRNQIMAQATNSANKNISQTVLENLCLKIPNKSEQENIGLYFSNLDKLITLHQRKLEEMKRQKKALMQLLLTGIVRV